MPRKPKQVNLFRLRKSRKREFKPRPATKHCAQCDNMLNRYHIEPQTGERWFIGSLRCVHKGRMYLINGIAKMTLCVCCLNRLRKKTPGVVVKEVIA